MVIIKYSCIFGLMPLSEHILTVIQSFSHAQSVTEPNFARYLRLMKFKLSPIIGLAFIIQSQADAKDIYVATDGNDLSSGAVGAPFGSIQHAVDVALAGDTIFIRGGRYHEEIDLSGKAGNDGSPITLTNFGDETVTLDGTQAITSGWTQDVGNVFKTTLTEDVTQLFVDGKLMTLARFPNALAWSDEMWRARTNKQAGSSRGNVKGAAIVGDAAVSFEGCIGLFNFGNFETIASFVSEHEAESNDFKYSPTAGIYRHSDAYFLEGGVGNAERAMLDIAQEWAYDETTKTLYLWADDGLDPTGREIAGKVQKYAVSGDATTKNIVLDGIDFFATAFVFNSSDGITIQNCDFRYHSASDRAIGLLDAPSTAEIVGVDDDRCEDILLFNNTFRYSDGMALSTIFGFNVTYENNHFEDANYSCLMSTGVRAAASQNLILRRNTLINSGPFAGFRFGRNANDDDGGEIYSYILEENYAEKCSRLQEDGTAFYSALTSLVNSIWRNNWAYDNYEIDYRFDGANTPVVAGVLANIYRNVAFATQDKPVNQIGAAYKLKGDFHEIYNNIAIGGRGDFEVSIEKGGNVNSFSYNNAGDKLSGSDDLYAPIPGTESNNFQGQLEPRAMSNLLRDPSNFDFRPKADAVELIDQGREVAIEVDGAVIDVTAGFNGSAPDIGAYEYGDESYLIPGYQAPQASNPYPADGRADALYDTELMWLGGLNAVSYRIYLGETEAFAFA